MPAGDPWQKSDTGVSEASHRLAMVELLVAGHSDLVVDSTEIARTGSSYTVETLEQLDDRVVLILGADAARGISTWHRAAELPSLVDLAVVPRAGVDRADVEAAFAGSITWLDMDPVDVSSTRIRQLARSGAEYSKFLPEAVAGYIESHRLYGSRGNRHGDSLSSSPMTKRSHTAAPDAIEAARRAAEALDDKSGEDIVLLDLSDLLVVTDVFVLATGTSRRNVLTLADEVVEALRGLDRRPIRKEGTDHGKWVLLDYGDVVIHLFDRQTREYYDLERLWADAPRIEFEPSSSTTEA
jgi:ribosome-associated protein